MRRQDLEHIIRAAAAITNEYEFVIIGSQSILGALPNAPAVLLRSMEADIYPVRDPEKSDLIDGAIGEASNFMDYYGYYAQGVGVDTAVLPEGWEQRVVKIQNQNTDLKIGYCLGIYDLAASKLAASRPKDMQFVKVMIEHRLISPIELIGHLQLLPIEATEIERLKHWSVLQNQALSLSQNIEQPKPKMSR